MAEHEMTTRATTTKIVHIDFRHRDFEVRAITQRHTPTREMVARPNESE